MFRINAEMYVFCIMALIILADAQLNYPSKKSCALNMIGVDCDYKSLADSNDEPSIEMIVDSFEERQNPVIPRRHLGQIINKRRELNYVRNALQDVDEKLEKIRKRSCLINMPGLNCDFNQMVGTGKDLGVWSSLASPGKKRRYRRSYYNQ